MEGICRGCLIKCEDTMELLQYTEKNRRLYVYSTGLQVKRNDTFTFQLCKGCYINMKLACKFKKQCRNSDKRFKNFLHLKENGEATDFETYLKANEDSVLLGFPMLSGLSYSPTVKRSKEDDIGSTSTSIRNFVKELLQPDEIPDTEARIIKQVIEEEADVMDDSLDSHWLQDDMSIDTDFHFSFSPFSTPKRKNGHEFNTPKRKTQSPEEQANSQDKEDIVINTRGILAAKKMLLKSTDNKTPSEIESSSPAKDNYEYSIIKEELDDDSLIEDCRMDIDHETFIASKRILLNRENNAHNIKEELDRDENLSTWSMTSLDVELYRQEHVTVTRVNGKEIIKYSDGQPKLNNNVELPLKYSKNKVTKTQVSIDKTLEQALLQCTEDDTVLSTVDKDSIDKNLEKALQFSENQEVPLNAIIATPTIRPGVSGPITPMIHDILFGDKLELRSENHDQNKAGHTIENHQNVEGSGVDILEDFFNKETGEYIGERKELNGEVNTNFEPSFCGSNKSEGRKRKISEIKTNNEVEHPLIKLGPAPYDLSDMSCKLCDRKFDHPKGLRIHLCKKHKLKLDRIHTTEPIVETSCDVCGREFKRLSNLSQHLKRCAKVESKVKCKQCSLEFTNNSRLLVHMKTHKNVTIQSQQPKGKVQICATCGYKSNSSSNFRVHMMRHSKKHDFSCQVCKAVFYRKTDLTTHERTHNGLRPYQCSHCTKSFGRSDILNRHMKLHTDEKHFKCTICNLAFVDKQALQKHTTSLKCRKKTAVHVQKENSQISVENAFVVSNADIIKNIGDVIIEVEEVVQISGENPEEEDTLGEDGEKNAKEKEKSIEVFKIELEKIEQISIDPKEISGNGGVEDNAEEQKTNGDKVPSDKSITPLVSTEIGLHLLLNEEDGNDFILPYSVV